MTTRQHALGPLLARLRQQAFYREQNPFWSRQGGSRAETLFPLLEDPFQLSSNFR